MLPVYVRLVYADGASPLRAQVLDALAQAAREARVEVPPMGAEDTLWESFHRQGARFWSADNLPVTPVLVLDQFEEAFTLGREKGRAAATAGFVEELGDLVEGRAPPRVRARLEEDPRHAREFVFNQHPYKVLLSIREDFLAVLETLRARIPSIAANRMRLNPLSGSAALGATAAGGTALVPPQVGELIVRLVAEEQAPSLPLVEMVVDPALLSLFCRALNDRRRALGLPSVTADLVKGNRYSILADFYEESVRGLGSGVRTLIEEQLLTVTGFRDSEAVENALATPGVTPETIDALVERRLIRREARDGQTRIELTHDVLTPVVRQSRDQRRVLAEQAAARRRVRRWISAAAFFFLLGVGAVALALRARASERRALESERRALQQAELGTELRRVSYDNELQDVARDSALLVMHRVAWRRVEAFQNALQHALCDDSVAGDSATLWRVRQQVQSELGGAQVCP
jgi:hypothetical protein